MKILYTSVIFLILFSTCYSQNQTCIFQFGDLKYDLTNLSTDLGYSYSSGQNTTYWNFCGKSPSKCSNQSAVCQVESNVSTFSLGGIDTQSVVQLSHTVLEVTFSKGDNNTNSGSSCPNNKPRKTIIQIFCKSSPMAVVSYGENPTCTYNIMMTGLYACPITPTTGLTTISSSSQTSISSSTTGQNNSHSMKNNLKITMTIILSLFIIILVNF